MATMNQSSVEISTQMNGELPIQAFSEISGPEEDVGSISPASSEEECNLPRRRTQNDRRRERDESEDDESPSSYGEKSIDVKPQVECETKPERVVGDPQVEVSSQPEEATDMKKVRKEPLDKPSGPTYPKQEEIFFKTDPTGQVKTKNFRSRVDNEVWPRDRLSNPPPKHRNDSEYRPRNYNRSEEYGRNPNFKKKPFNQNHMIVQVDSFRSPSADSHKKVDGTCYPVERGSENRETKPAAEQPLESDAESKKREERESVGLGTDSDCVSAKNGAKPEAAVTVSSRSYYYVDPSLMDQLSHNAKTTYSGPTYSGGDTRKTRQPKNVNGRFSPKVTVTTESKSLPNNSYQMNFTDKPRNNKQPPVSKRYSSMKQNPQSPSATAESPSLLPAAETSWQRSSSPAPVEVTLSSIPSRGAQRIRSTSSVEVVTEARKVEGLTETIKTVSISSDKKVEQESQQNRSSSGASHNGNDSRVAHSNNNRRQAGFPSRLHPPPPPVVTTAPVHSHAYSHYQNPYEQSYIMPGMYFQPNPTIYNPNPAYYDTSSAATVGMVPGQFPYNFFPQQFMEYSHPAFYYTPTPGMCDVPPSAGYNNQYASDHPQYIYVNTSNPSAAGAIPPENQSFSPRQPPPPPSQRIDRTSFHTRYSGSMDDPQVKVRSKTTQYDNTAGT